MKIKTDYVPEDKNYLTPGKIYEAERFRSYKNLVSIIDDEGMRILVFIPECDHLNDHPWEIVEK